MSTAIRNLAEVVAAVRALHVQGETTHVRYNHEGTLLSAHRKPDGFCRECSSSAWVGCCREDPADCDGPHTGSKVSWPCPTLHALDGGDQL